MLNFLYDEEIYSRKSFLIPSLMICHVVYLLYGIINQYGYYKKTK